MPAEPKQKLSRRPSSKREPEEFTAQSRELEQKRNRGEVSCAECRRLKIKCDKQIPCQSCQRRGCAALCPNGSLATGQGTRFVLAATEHLHKRISKLSGRVRQLEDALTTLHDQHSSDPHPLLQRELLAMAEESPLSEPQSEEPQPSADIIDAFGTLSISDHGVSRFFGPTGGPESLLISAGQVTPDSSVNSPDSKQASVSPTSSSAPHDLFLFSHAFPFSPMGTPEDVQEMIRGHLIPWDRACTLCQSYLQEASWIFRGVTREQLMDDMLPSIYHRCSASQIEEFSGPHDLALLFIIFAVGALCSTEPCHMQAEHFHQISKAAISLQPVLEKPTLVTIQCLHLMSIYNAMSASDLTSHTSMETTWSLVTLAAHLSQTIGLHRESERWGLSPKMVHRRRILFWDLFVADTWQSLGTGRPPSFSLAYVDCNFPQHVDEKAPDAVFELWQFRFASDCVAEVATKTLTAEAPSYATIMELDRKVREYPLPEGFADAAPGDLGMSFQRCVLEHVRETVLMTIHRSFFAQAIIEHPVNPLKSVYAPSFLAAYRASSTVLKCVEEQFEMAPSTTSRMWPMWTFAFSAAVVFGTVVTRGPRSPLAANAMSELERACTLFTRGSAHGSKRAAKALPILITLNDKARQALNDVASTPETLNSVTMLWDLPNGATYKESEDELSIFAGHTRFVAVKKPVRDQPVVPSMDHQIGPGPITHLPTLTTPAVWAQPPEQQMDYDYHADTSSSSSYRHMEGQYGYAQQEQPAMYDAPPPSAYTAAGLASMGISPREAKMDPRWGSFMQDTGYHHQQ